MAGIFLNKPYTPRGPFLGGSGSVSDPVAGSGGGQYSQPSPQPSTPSLPPPAPNVSGGDGGGGQAPVINQSFSYGAPTYSPAAMPSGEGGGGGGMNVDSLTALLATQKQYIDREAPGWQGIQAGGQVAPQLGNRSLPQSMQALRARAY